MRKMKFLDDAKQQVKDTVDEMTDETKEKAKGYMVIAGAAIGGFALGCIVTRTRDSQKQVEMLTQALVTRQDV